MKKKYRISLRVSGEDPRALGVRMPKLPWYARWLGMKVELGSNPEYVWTGFGSNAIKGVELLTLDRDEAKYLMSAILGGSHRERSAWITKWDNLKMVACITKSPTDEVTKDGKRFVMLQHANWVVIALHDIERDFTVFQQEMDFFSWQNLTLQD